ncbi:tudor domain-containing protein 1-like [Dendronephthya gigantea]|uniref:tudor domain-containing protein 1-like n=1 Tax=Dendronephthya gigantea TaxID=151771 RepID=UPI00106A1D4C|nr:tudor domain-containing protein 1-like [Dendronephthya gigantea]
MNEELFPEANNGSAATPRIMMPCTCCDKLCKQRCSACKAPYCSRECQKIDRVRHKLVCTYQNNSKPAKSEVKVPVATNGPMSAPDDLDNDSDFDCIDISLESSTSRKAKPNTEQRNDGDVSLDSSFCQDSGVVISRESPCEELNSDPRVATHTADINVIMASNVPNDVLPSTIAFDIVVCYFLTPNSFWIWFMNTAKELFIRLTSLLNETYEKSTYSEYMPVTGQLIAAKFNDDIWYRAKVNCVNKDYTINVTFIDFGNTENITVYNSRKITEALALIPRLATKCSLHTIEEPTHKWPTDTLHFCNELMLNKKGSAILHESVQDSLVLEINVEINGVMRSVVDEIVNQGHLILDKITTPDSVRHDLPKGEIPSKEEPVTGQHFPAGDKTPILRSNKPCFPDKETTLPLIQPISPSCNKLSYNKTQSLPSHCPTTTGGKPVVFSNLPGDVSNISLSKQAISCSSSVFPAGKHSTITPEIPVKYPAALSVPNSMRILPDDYSTAEPTPPISLGSQKFGLQSAVPSPKNVSPEQMVCQKVLPIPTLPSTPFDVIVNDVSTTERFYAQMIDPSLVRQLHKCVRKLNEYIRENHPPEKKNVIVGSLGCAKFSQDNIWYRAQVVAMKEASYRVRFIDFGNVEDVNPLEFFEGPESFFKLAPQAICCRLVTSGRFRADQSSNMMKALTLNKQFSCIVVGDVSCPEISVKLLSSVGGRVVDTTEELDKCINLKN